MQKVHGYKEEKSIEDIGLLDLENTATRSLQWRSQMTIKQIGEKLGSSLSALNQLWYCILKEMSPPFAHRTKLVAIYSNKLWLTWNKIPFSKAEQAVKSTFFLHLIPQLLSHIRCQPTLRLHPQQSTPYNITARPLKFITSVKKFQSNLL